MGRSAIFQIPLLFVAKVFFFLRHWFRTIKLSKHSIIDDAPNRPQQLSLEVTNLCNANCTFCAYQFQTRPVRLMPFELYRLAIDQYAKAGGGPIGLTPVVGDALIDKDLEKKVAYARLHGAITEIGLTTNAILLTSDRFVSLVKSGITQLEISMTGFDRQEYSRIYRNDSYEKVRKNLLAVAESSYFKKCPITISMRTDAWFPSFKKDYQLFKKKGFRILSTFFFDNWSGKIRIQDLSGRMMIRPKVRKTLPCRMLYSGPTVLSDGKITACGCRDVDGKSELVLGKLPETSLVGPWINGQMKKLRERFLTGDIPDICQDCRHYSPVTPGDLEKNLQKDLEKEAQVQLNVGNLHF